MKKISVIIPVFNCERYIEQSISSAINQTYHNLEIIVVNDGSTDKTQTILDSIRDPRIIILSQSRSGSSAARNSGIRTSSGQYIAFLDADDIWLPSKLEKQVTHLDERPEVAISFCLASRIDENGMNIGTPISAQSKKIIEVNRLELLYANPLTCCSTILARRDYLEKISTQSENAQKKYFDESLCTAEDLDLLIRITELGEKKIQGLPEILVKYRIISESLSSNINQMDRSLMLIRERYFSIFSVDNNKAIKQKCLAFHYRYLAQTSLMRSDHRLMPIKYMLKSLLNSTVAIRNEPVSTIGTIILSIFQLIAGKNIRLKAMKLRSYLSASRLA